MKKILYAVMLLLGLSTTVSGIAQKTDYKLELKKCRERLVKELANHQYDWLYGTWRLEELDETIVIEKDYVYYGEDRSRKEPFNLHYELEDPYSEYLDYGIYLYIGGTPVDENSECLYFADEYSMYFYKKISDYNEFEGQEIFTIVEKMPSFPGNEHELMEFITRNIQYPQEAQGKGIQGRVFVSFVVEPDGSVSNVKVRQGIGSGCDEEAVRIVKSMPKWNPGEKKGKPVRVSYSLPIVFKLQ